jgi:hypothetical protein
VTRLTPAQIATAAAGAGFTGTGLRDAVAVALAESGGNPTAVNTNADRWHSRDRGLWQINDHWHPEVSDAAAFNPATAAQAAYRISGGGKSWSAWSTWNNGAAAAQLGRAQLAAAQAGKAGATAQPADWKGLGEGMILGGPLGAVIGGINGAENPLTLYKQMAVLVVHAAAWIADPHNWERVAMVTGGTVAVLLALEMIGKSGAAGSTAGRVAAMPMNAAKKAGKAAAVAAAA